MMYQNNPYLQNMASPYTTGQGMQQILPQRQVPKCKGRAGAEAYQMGINSSEFILDESGLIVWLVVTDMVGNKTVTPYDIAPHQEEKEPDLAAIIKSLGDRIGKMEAKLNAAEDTTATKR